MAGVLSLCDARCECCLLNRQRAGGSLGEPTVDEDSSVGESCGLPDHLTEYGAGMYRGRAYFEEYRD